jgi:hypothetical protein
VGWRTVLRGIAGFSLAGFGEARNIMVRLRPEVNTATCKKQLGGFRRAGRAFTRGLQVAQLENLYR